MFSLGTATQINQTWSIDFMHDKRSNSQVIRLLNVVYDFKLPIQPGKPQQNAYVERYNRTVRYDWLAQNICDEPEEDQSDATRWLWVYNNERPNMAIGGIPPKQKLNNIHLINSTQIYC